MQVAPTCHADIPAAQARRKRCPHTQRKNVVRIHTSLPGMYAAQATKQIHRGWAPYKHAKTSCKHSPHMHAAHLRHTNTEHNRPRTARLDTASPHRRPRYCTPRRSARPRTARLRMHTRLQIACPRTARLSTARPYAVEHARPCMLAHARQTWILHAHAPHVR